MFCNGVRNGVSNANLISLTLENMMVVTTPSLFELPNRTVRCCLFHDYTHPIAQWKSPHFEPHFPNGSSRYVGARLPKQPKTRNGYIYWIPNKFQNAVQECKRIEKIITFLIHKETRRPFILSLHKWWLWSFGVISWLCVWRHRQGTENFIICRFRQISI